MPLGSRQGRSERQSHHAATVTHGESRCNAASRWTASPGPFSNRVNLLPTDVLANPLPSFRRVPITSAYLSDNGGWRPAVHVNNDDEPQASHVLPPSVLMSTWVIFPRPLQATPLTREYPGETTFGYAGEVIVGLGTPYRSEHTFGSLGRLFP